MHEFPTTGHLLLLQPLSNMPGPTARARSQEILWSLGVPNFPGNVAGRRSQLRVPPHTIDKSLLTRHVCDLRTSRPRPSLVASPQVTDILSQRCNDSQRRRLLKGRLSDRQLNRSSPDSPGVAVALRDTVAPRWRCESRLGMSSSHTPHFSPPITPRWQ